MVVSRIQASNFKSFRQLDAPLGELSTLIGANASGKSNFTAIFRFLRDISDHGLRNAVSLQGGPTYLTNLGLGVNHECVVEAHLKGPFRRLLTFITEKTGVGMETATATYRLALGTAPDGRAMTILDETLDQDARFITLEEERKGRMTERELRWQGRVVISNSRGKIETRLEPPPSDEVKVQPSDILPSFGNGEPEQREPGGKSLLNMSWLVPPLMALTDVGIYDFDPKLPKRSVPITARAELEEDGNNLALVLQGIVSDGEKKRQLSNLVSDLLPFVQGLDIVSFADKSLLFKVQEQYFPTESFPASLVSDGTINALALVLALYFETKSIKIIEEPERNIHPSLLARVLQMMREASKGKQIIVTTHNPEIVRHSEIGDLLLVARDQDGFSRVSRPADDQAVKEFLSSELGIADLYVGRLLERPLN